MMISIEEIKNLRLKYGFTQKEMANLLHISHYVYNKWENGATPRNESVSKALGSAIIITSDLATIISQKPMLIDYIYRLERFLHSKDCKDSQIKDIENEIYRIGAKIDSIN